LRQVEFFKYLGILFSSDGTQKREIDRRINQASLVARELWNTVIGNTRLSRGAKLSIYRSLFKSTLTYGLETWILTEETRSRVQVAEMRKVVGVTRRDRIRNSQIREELGVSPLILEVERGQLRWLGHV